MMTASNPPRIGTRIIHGGDVGTIRFIGSVDGSRGEWLGIEWDDPRRGKHDGVKDDKRYFSCRVPNSGSFLRPTAAGLSFGTSFLNALTSKYVEALRDSAQTEKVILGSSNGTIEVEAVGLDKIRHQLSQLDSIREVSLDHQDVAYADEPGSIRQTCPGIRGLDLSHTLIPSWDMVAIIATELPHLQRLALNQNRFAFPSITPSTPMDGAFRNLKELQLNATYTSWLECRVIITFMPVLELVEVGYNRLTNLNLDGQDEIQAATSTLKDNLTIQTINFDGNQLRDWESLCQALRPLLGLQRLILSSNEIDSITPPPKSESDGFKSPIHNLQYLALSFNSVKNLSDFDNFPLWCPNVTSLKVIGNPLGEVGNESKYVRQFIIAKIASLETLDAATITPHERSDSERFYLSWIVKHDPQEDEEARRKKHPRWRELCKIHGKPDEPSSQSQAKQDTLGSRLFQITVRQLLQDPPTTRTAVTAVKLGDPPVTLRVLPTMTIRTFRLKLVKALKLKVSKTQTAGMRMWLVMPDKSLGLLENERDSDDLAWFGIEDGTEVVLYVPS